MATVEYTPIRVPIKQGERTVCEVRGLGTDDVSVLIRAHFELLNTLFGLAQNSERQFGSTAFFMQMITEAPNIAFDIIALATDEPNYASSARQMPVGLQIKILQEITRLTFEDIGGPKVAVAMIRNALSDQLQKPVQATPTIQ